MGGEINDNTSNFQLSDHPKISLKYQLGQISINGSH